jgi:hypothetical protein
MPLLTITAQEIAEILQMNVRTFLRKREKMEAEGLPRRVPGTSVWSRRLVLAWIGGGAAATYIDEEEDPVAAARADLESRIGERSAA